LGPEHATLSPDGQFLCVANVAGNAVSVIDLAAAKTVQVVKGLSQPHIIVFAPDGKAYVTQVGSYHVAVLTPEKATPVARIAAGSSARLASLHPQKVQGVNNAALVHGLLFATNQDAGEAAVIDSARDAVMNVIKVGREPWEPYETPDHTKIVVPNLADRTVSVIGVASQKVLAPLPGGKDMTGVVVTADSSKAYVVHRGDGKVSVIDLEPLQVTGEIPVGRSPEVATRTAGGKIYVANSGSASVSVIDAGTDRVVTTIANVGKHPWALASFNGYNYCH
jgi:YVTN family beta-propeller protein